MRNFKNYDIWVDAKGIVDEIYAVIDEFSKMNNMP